MVVVQGGKRSTHSTPKQSGGSNTSVTSAPLSERVTTAKISHVKPIKVCLTVVLRMKQIHFQPNLAHINPLC